MKELKPITFKEARLAGRLLELASDYFSNHGCNDIQEEIWGDLTTEERQALVKQYHEWNGDPEEYEGQDDTEDWLLMRLLSEKLKSSK